jgi:hypothetical protein
MSQRSLKTIDIADLPDGGARAANGGSGGRLDQ